MNNKEKNIMQRLEQIANKVYRNSKNALFMLVNDLEEVFEMNKNDINQMTTENLMNISKKFMNSRKDHRL